jgi:AraC-like DNA-binding protein
MTDDGLIDQVVRSIREHLPRGQATARLTALRLGMSYSTFRLELRRYDTSFRALLAKVREQAAVEYLRADSPSLPRVAFLLGFESVGGFRLWFGKQFGMGPTTWRSKQQSKTMPKKEQ